MENQHIDQERSLLIDLSACISIKLETQKQKQLEFLDTGRKYTNILHALVFQ